MTTNFETQSGPPNRGKFLVGGLVMLVGVVYLIITSTIAGAEFFLTVDELIAKSETMMDKPVRVTGAVLAETINYDMDTLTLEFTVVHIPADNDMLEDEGGLAAALHAAVSDPNRQRLQIVYYGVKPDLLQHESQAIMSGKLGADGIFYADELLLKCPTKYEEALPEQSDV